MKKIDEKSVKKYEKKKTIIFGIVVLILWLFSIFGLIYRASSDETQTSDIYHSQEIKRAQTQPFPNNQLQSISTLNEGDVFLSNFGYAFNVLYQNGNDFTQFVDLIYGEVILYTSTNNILNFPGFIPFYHTLPYKYGYGNYVFTDDYEVPGLSNFNNYPNNQNVYIGTVGCNVGDTIGGSSFTPKFTLSYTAVSDNPDYDFMYRLISIYSAYSFNFDTLLVYSSSNPIFTDEFWDLLFSDYGIGCYKIIAPEDPDALENAYQTGYDNGLLVGDQEGYERGYGEGYTDGDEEQFTTNSFKTLFNMILNAPYNIFKGMFNFEVFGVNLFGFFSFIFTTLLIIAIINFARRR